MSGFGDRLRAELSSLDALGDDPVAELDRLSGGASRQTWALTLSSGRELIVQCTRPGAAFAGPGMEAEGRLLRAAADHGVPVPRVVAAGPGEELGAPFVVTERLAGESLGRTIRVDDRFAGARGALTGQLATAAAAIHTIDPAAVPELRGGDQLALIRSGFDGFDEPHPAFELAFRWLERHRPPVADETVVHGDYRLGNFLVDETGLVAVLDWELAHRGDPVEDLGWLCVRAWRFGGDRPVAGIGAYDELLQAYAAASGRPVSSEALRWWELFGVLKWGVVCMVQAQSHLAGLSRSVELAAIGRRVAETEYDALTLLGIDVPAPSVVEESDGSDDLFGRPTLAELLEAVREFVEGDVRAATEGRVRFHAKVAANVLGAVERESALGPVAREANARRLAELGLADDRALATAIRAGEVADAEVVTAVAASVADKLAVSNPSYRSGDDGLPPQG